MNIVLLKSKTDRVNIATQQDTIIKYARANGFAIDNTEIESSDASKILEERSEFKGFLRSLSHHDHIFVYDLWTFSDDVGELTKILECLLKRSITAHLCSQNISIDVDTNSLETLTVLSKFREKNLTKDKTITQGRPKGRMSKSKFDNQRVEIIDFLSEGYSVSKIARELDVSRTSLKDYINSRGLKDLVEAKKTLLTKPKKQPKKQIVDKNKKCDLIKEEQKEKEDAII